MTVAKIDSLYRHQKGGLYHVTDIATHTETGEEMVIYKNVHTGEKWARPRAMFEGDKDGKPRFTPL